MPFHRYFFVTLQAERGKSEAFYHVRICMSKEEQWWLKNDNADGRTNFTDGEQPPLFVIPTSDEGGRSVSWSCGSRLRMWGKVRGCIYSKVHGTFKILSRLSPYVGVCRDDVVGRLYYNARFSNWGGTAMREEDCNDWRTNCTIGQQMQSNLRIINSVTTRNE